MNYIDLILSFWRSHDEHSFATTDIALYFYLLEVCNGCRWKNPFKRNNAKIMADLGIKDRRTLDNSRNRLKQAGLIDFQKNTTNPNVTYTITCALNAQVIAQADAQVIAQADAQVGDTKYKLNKTKQKDIGDKSPPTPKSLFEKIEERKVREKKFYESLMPFLESFPKEMIREFYDHWSEPNKSGTQMKWELQPTFELSRRLATWQRNSDRWGIKSKHEKNEATGEIDPRIQEKLAKLGGISG